MAIVARGHTDDRPFARTIYAIGAKRFTGDLIVEHLGKKYVLGWADGQVVAADSPSAHDSPARVALTAGLVSSTQLGDVLRAQQAAPGRDPIGVLGEIAKLSVEQIETVRRRTLAHRAVRVFALESASFVLDDVSSLAPERVPPLTPHWIVYNGVRAHYTEARLLRELASMASNASTFVLNEAGNAALGAFGFGDAEQPLLRRLTQPVSIITLAEEHPGLDRKALGAILYALAATAGVDITNAPTNVGHGSQSTRLPVTRPAPAATAPPPVATTPEARHHSSSSRRIPVRSASTSGSHATSQSHATSGSHSRAGSHTGSGSHTAADEPGHTQSSSTTLRASGSSPGMANQVRGLIRAGLDKLNSGADHFAILGLVQGAAVDQVRAAYFELARALHPDRIRALQLDDIAKDAQRLFAQINTAFAILSHPKRRDEYLQMLHAGGEKAVKARAAEAETKAHRLLAAEDAFRRGEMALRRDHFAEAYAAFKQAVELNPEEGEHHAAMAWSNWCMAPDKAKVLSEVRRSLDRGMELAPHNAKPFLYRGRVAKHEGKEELALHCFERVIELEPHNADALAEVRLLASRRSKSEPKGGGIFGRFRKP